MPEAPGGAVQVYCPEDKVDSPDPDGTGLPRAHAPSTDPDNNVPNRTRSALALADEIDLESGASSLMAEYSAKLTAHTTSTTDDRENDTERTWRDERLHQINQALLALSLGYAIRFSGCSTRLANAAERAGFDRITLADYLTDPPMLMRELHNLKGIGRKTIDEGIDKVEKFVEAAARVSAVAASVETQPLNSPVNAQRASENIGGVEPAPMPAQPAAPVDLRSPRERLADAVARLPDKEQFVIEGRFGLNGQTERTLQELADEAQVTRERIRQIEAKALRHLRLPMHRVVLNEFLRAEKDAIWSAIAGGNDLVSPPEFRDARSKLDPWQLLAIELVHDTLRDWLGHHATTVGNGWLRHGADPELLRKSTEELEAFAHGHGLPMPMESARSLLGMDEAMLDVAVENSNQVTMFEAYLCEGYVGMRARRTVRLHAAAARMNATGPFDIATLAGRLRAKHPDDGAGPRVIQMQMEEATHLFCRLYDNLWFALPAEQGGGQMSRMPFERETVLEPSFDPGSIGAELVDLLRAGPMRHVDLREGMVARHGDRIAESSVGAVLASNPCFRRVAPGIFDLCRPGQVYDEHGVLNKVFLDERQCRAFCLARHGGAPVDWYPAWGPSLEMWLARWAKVKAGPDLFRSLISVADPSAWPAPADELAYWNRIKEREGTWLLGAERRTQLGRRFVEPGQFLATLAHLVFFGWTSWVAVNRTTDARGDVHDAADILAILVKAGLARTADDWQGRHEATALAAVVFQSACHEMHVSGVLERDNGVLAEVWSAAAAGANGELAGWIEPDEYAEALEQWRSSDVRSSRSFARKTVEAVNPGTIFESDAWGQLFSEG